MTTCAQVVLSVMYPTGRQGDDLTSSIALVQRTRTESQQYLAVLEGTRAGSQGDFEGPAPQPSLIAYDRLRRVYGYADLRQADDLLRGPAILGEHVFLAPRRWWSLKQLQDPRLPRPRTLPVGFQISTMMIPVCFLVERFRQAAALVSQTLHSVAHFPTSLPIVPVLPALSSNWQGIHLTFPVRLNAY